MTNWTSSNYTNATTGRPWQEHAGSITKIVINGGVKTIGDYAFIGMTAVTSVTFNTTYAVTSIGQYAFYGCTGITSISIPSGVTTIGQYAFYNCSKITSVTIPFSVTSIGSSAFYGCSKITTVIYASTATNWANINFANSYANPIYYAKRLNCNNSENPTTSMSSIGSATVHKIKQYAFYNDTAITTLSFNASVDSIAANAFNGCKGIKSITVIANMKNIAPSAFSSCTNLATVTWNATNYTAPTGYSTSPFYYPNTYIKTFKFGSSVTNIPAYVCYGMTNLEAITLPTNTTTIGQNAFQNCSKVAELEVPSSVTSIGAEAFKGCTGLTKILACPVTPPTASANTFTSVSTTIPVIVTSSDAVTSYGEATGWSDFTNITTTVGGSCGTSATWSLNLATGVMTIGGSGAMDDYSTTSDVPWYTNYRTYVTSIIISEGVTTIGNRAFHSCSNAISVDIASTITSIGEYAFSSCTTLGTIKFGTSVDYQCNIDTIKGSAFSDCSAVNKVYCYGGIEKWLAIGFNSSNANPFGASSLSKTFYIDGSSKTSITISGDQVKPYAFYKSPVSTVNLSASVKTIGTSAFESSKLTTLNFAENAELTKICTTAFKACTSLKTPTLPISLTTIEGNAFNGCASTYFKSITIPENVTICGDGVFSGCSNLNSVVWNAKNCTTYNGTNPYAYNYGPFYNTTLKPQITSFTFGDSVKVIPMYCCYNMPNITLLTVPDSVKSIGEKAFSGCTGLTTIVAKPVDPSSCGTNAFESVNKDIPVVLTSPTSVADYISAGGWSDFTNISNTLSGSCGTNATWTLNLATGLLTISGTGAINNYTSSNPAPWNDYITYISDIVINSGITTLGERCFASCDVDTLNIPASVTQIESQSFLSAKAKKLYYGSTISNWCSITMGSYNTLPQTQELYVNGSDSKITNLTLPNITSLGSKAFMNMKGITSVTIPDSLTSIGADAFSGCSNLADVYFQGTLAQWCAINFSNDQEANPAYNGASLHITDSDIDGATIVAKDAITSISNYAFCGVNNYESIEINATTTIGTYTFKNCTAQILYRGSASGTSGNVSWTWNNGVLTLTGTGTMNNYTTTPNAPWSQYMPSTTSIIVGEGITSIGDYAFYATAAPMVTLSLPSTLTSIGKSVGYGLKDLRVLVIPDGVTTIGSSAFSGCTNLEKIYCPATRPTLNKDYGAPVYTNFPSNKAFYVTVSSYSSQYAGQWTDFSPQWHIEGNCGAEEGGLNQTWTYTASDSTLTISGTGKMTDYNYTGENVSPWYALKNRIKVVNVEEGVRHLGAYAFRECSELAIIHLPASIDTMSNSVYSICNKLTDYTYAGDLEKWLAIDFAGLAGNPIYATHKFYLNGEYPESITLPNTITKVPGNAFYNCSTLVSVVIPEGIDTIEDQAFQYCIAIDSITLPMSLRFVGTRGLYSMTNLHKVKYNGTASDWCRIEFEASTSQPIYGNADARLYCQGVQPTELIVPDDITSIGNWQFYKVSSLESVTISENVTSIGTNAFYNTGITSVIWNAKKCPDFASSYNAPFDNRKTSITSFTFGDAVEYIPAYLCYGMSNTKFTSISIPASVDSIGAYVFEGCTNLDSVICEGTTPPTLASGAFSSPSTKKLYVHHSVSAKAAYRAASGWNSFTEANTFPKIVQFSLNGKSGDAIDPQYFDNLTSKASAPSDPADVNYHSFSGWYQEAECENAFNFEGAITQDTILYAKWTIYNYQVTFDMQGHGSSIAAQTIDHNGLVSEPSAPSETGYTFGGWFKEAGCNNAWNFSEDHVTEATTLYALWTINQYTVSFVSNGGSAVSSITQNYNTEIAAPTDPTRDGYTFNGWIPAVPSTMPAVNTECVAQWTINNYDVTFNMQGHGDALDAQSINYNGLVSQPSAPSATGYTFGGWFKEAGCANEWNFSTDPVTDVTILYAKWTINSYDVTFNLQGHGTPIAPQSVDYNGLVSQPSAPSEAGFAFDGWYKEAGCINAWNFSEDRITEATTLYAKWSVAPLTLNDNADNSEAIESYDGLTTGVTMIRTIISASYNTICLPFAMTASQVETYFGTDCDIEELTKASCADGNLKLFFTKRTAIEAGKPYLIKPQADVANPVIADVTIDNTSRPSEFEGVTFSGIFSPENLVASENLLFLGASNMLYMSSGGTMKGLRGYFQLTTPGSIAAAKRSARIVLHEEVATDIEIVESQKSKVESTKIMRDGQLYILRDGKTYNAQGALIK